jgi:hypothetical protein
MTTRSTPAGLPSTLFRISSQLCADNRLIAVGANIHTSEAPSIRSAKGVLSKENLSFSSSSALPACASGVVIRRTRRPTPPRRAAHFSGSGTRSGTSESIASAIATNAMLYASIYSRFLRCLATRRHVDRVIIGLHHRSPSSVPEPAYAAFQSSMPERRLARWATFPNHERL